MSAYSALILSEPGLVNYWRLGEAAGNAVDGKGGADAAPSGGLTRAVPSLVGGDPANAAARFNGTSGKFVGPGVSLPVPGLWSVELWLRTTVGAQRPAFSTRGSNGTVYIGTCNSPAGAFFCYWHGAGGLAQNNTGVTVLTDGKPHHCVVTWDGTSIRLYVDGALDKTDAGTVPLTPVASPGTSIGWDAPNITEWWPGDVDEIAVYTGVTLSLAQIQKHYQTGIAVTRPTGSRITVAKPIQVRALAAPGDYLSAILADNPAAYFRLDDLGAVVVDQKGGPSGALTGLGVSRVPGATADGNGGMAFTGQSGLVSVPDAPAHNFGVASFSVEAWINLPALPNNPKWYYGKGAPYSDSGPGWAIISWDTTNAAPQPTFYWSDGVAGHGNWQFAQPAAPPCPRGSWAHIVFVYDRAGAIARAYGNGIAGSTAAINALMGSVSTATPLTLGQGQGNPYWGGLDEFAIYPYVLTPAQILAHFRAGQRLQAPGQRLSIGGRQTVRAT